MNINRNAWMSLIMAAMIYAPGYGQTYSFVHDSLSRSYVVHLPTGYDALKQYPLVINMHGLSSNALQQQFYSAMDAVADTGSFIVIYPDGISNAWNSGFNSPYNSGVDDVGFLSALLDTAMANYSVDGMRLYACGMSNGGFMSYRLACELENRIAAIASVTGSMPDSMQYYCQDNRPVPVMQIHGTADPVVNYNGAPGIVAIESTVAYWVQKNSCPLTPILTAIPDISSTDLCTAEKFYYGLCSDSTEVMLLKVTNGGHTWPGAFAVPSLGNTNQDFNASGEIWKFFRRHKLSPIPVPVAGKDFGSTTEIKLWPNPAADDITISGLITANPVITAVNVLGQKVNVAERRGLHATFQNGTSLHNYDISNLESGVYFLLINAGSGPATLMFMKR